MNRLLVALLAAFDAAVAAAVGIAAALAPLTLLWVIGMDGAGIEGLWPTSAAVWQLGHLVPLGIWLPEDYLIATGIDPAASSFALSLAPLAFAGFTAVFAARSGARAARAGAGPVGVIVGGVLFCAVGIVVWATSRVPVVTVAGWQAVLLPTLVFVLPAAAGAVVAGWDADETVLDRLRAVMEARLPADGALVPELAARGAALVLTALLGAGALMVIIALLGGGGKVVALYQAGNLDVAGVITVSLAQLAFLPTLVIWGAAFVAGPGFAVSTGTAVSPAGTQLGIVPPLPILGALPSSTSWWLLILVLVPIGAAAFSGVMLRSRMRRLGVEATPALRAVLAVAVALLSAGGAALLAQLASGSIGPGRLAHLGPSVGALALAVGVETLVGAAIMLLTPVHEMLPGAAPAPTAGRTSAAVGAAEAPASASPAPSVQTEAVTGDEDGIATVPIDPGPWGDDESG